MKRNLKGKNMEGSWGPLRKKKSFKDYKKYVIGEFPLPKDGEPCEHKGCLNHLWYPCEGCDRIGGSSKLTKEYYEKNRK